MAKVTVNTPTTPFKLNLQQPASEVVSELKQLLAMHKDINFDLHKSFSDAIEKDARSALEQIKTLKAIEPPPIPTSSPPNDFLSSHDYST